MALRVESNMTLAARAGSIFFPQEPQSPEERWISIHEFNVDTGYIYTVLLIILSCENLVPPLQSAVNMAVVRVYACLNVITNQWSTRYEGQLNGAGPTGRQGLPTMIILPLGTGLPLTAGQGMAASILQATATQFRYWAAFLGNSDKT